MTMQNEYPSLPYVAVAEAFKLPAGMNFRGTSGVAFNSKGNIFVIHRGPMSLMEFDPDGNFIRGFGDGLFERAHGLRIDAQDNIWATDVASNLVYKFDPSGRLEMVLGVKGHSGEWHPYGHLRLFHEPSEAVVGPSGDIFVLQGHGKGDSRVLKFDRDGNFIKDWGGKGSEPGQFNLPHSLVFDAQGLLYIADRNNARIQVFDADGNYIREFAASRHTVRIVHGRRSAHLAGAWSLRPDHETRSQRQGDRRDGRRGLRQDSGQIRRGPLYRGKPARRDLRGRHAELARAEIRQAVAPCSLSHFAAAAQEFPAGHARKLEAGPN